MIFRFADHDDIDRLIDLRLEFFRDSKQDLPDLEPIIENIRTYLSEHLGRDCLALLAEDEGLIAATSFLITFRRPPNPVMPNGRIGEIYNVMTRPAYRGRGLASKLVERLVEEGRRLDLTRIDLSATAESRKMYEKLGFQEHEGYTLMSLSL